MIAQQSKANLVTVGLTDFYHAGALKDFVHRRQWPRFETRIERNTLKTLDLLDRCNTKATIFVMGWVAERQPELIREVAKRGHEIANMGFYQRNVCEMTPVEFEEDLKRSQAAIEDAIASPIFGYRLARPLFRPNNLWVLDILARAGYAYDSSIFPLFQYFRSEPWRRFPHQHRCEDHVLWEFPCSTWKFLGNAVPISGGNYFRQLPQRLIRMAVTDWVQKYDTPFLMYFHVWDLDPNQPKITSASPLARVRAYRNLDKMYSIIEDYLRAFRFGTIAAHLGITNIQTSASIRKAPGKPFIEVTRTQPKGTLTKSEVATTSERVVPTLSIVIPCFNEEPVLPYLRNTLRSVKQSLERNYKIRFIFVDDGSTDGTWRSLQDLFGANGDCKLVRQPGNRGVGSAILAGILAAESELVCSIDCDCTYDPHDLEKLVPQLTEGVALVTGSPYHPDGRVFNVPRWRLALSKTASSLYRIILRNKLHTYTSCFRAYRRSAVVGLNLKEGGFLGIAELLGKLDLQGSKIVECPTTLEVRILGVSKMRTIRTILGHLRLLTSLLAARLEQGYSIVAQTALPVHPLKDRQQEATSQHQPK